MKPVKNVAIILIIFFLINLLFGCSNDKEIIQIDLGRGVNLGNALEAPKEGEWGVTIEDYFFGKIKEVGFQTVRIPIKWSANLEDRFPYEIEESLFQRIDYVINQTIENDLNVIINIHHFDKMTENPVENEEKLYQIWRQIAERYSGYSSLLIFELFNEPHDALTSNLWNQFAHNLVNIIRETNPERKIVIGPVFWNSLYSLDTLLLPNDPHLIVTFHYYLPFPFTHQGAEWVEGSELWLGTKWEGTAEEKLNITNDLDRAVEWASGRNVSLFMGEFGAYYKADYNSRVEWTRFLAREAEKRDISWAYWEFGARFGIYSIENDEWDSELLNSLIPQN